MASAVEVVANNLDLVSEILVRLPTKPLVTLKSVCKQWLSLISNPQFCVSHTRLHHSQNPTPTALLLNKTYTPSTPEFKILPLEHDTICKTPFLNYLNANLIRILQSCNGLLFCTFIYTADDYDIKYFICNPTTNQFKKIPFPSRQFSDSVSILSLAFDPLKSIHYKVIAFTYIKKPCQIYIYSSETDSWSPTEITFIPPVGIGLYGGVFCNGAIHWDSEDVNSLYFDVDRECLNTMPMPPYSDGRYNRTIQYFGESRGHLHLIVKDSYFTLKFNVLEMATDYSEWFVRYCVNLSALRIEFRKLFWHDEEEYRHPVSILCVIRAEKEEESMVVVYLNGRAISYNVYDGTTKELRKLQVKSKECVPRLDYEGSDAYQYFETLSCV